MDTEEKIVFLGEAIRSVHNLYLWHYDGGLNLLSSNCPQELGMEALLSLDGQKEKLLDYAAGNDAPIIMENSVSLLWIAAPEKLEGTVLGFHILGPFFMDEAARRGVENHLAGLDLSQTLKAEIGRFVRSLPIISLNRVFEYGIMLHFAVTGERIKVGDLRYEAGQLEDESAPVGGNIVHGTYEAEQEMLRKVREGDMGFVDEIVQMTTMGTLGKLSSDSSIRQFKNAVLVCVTLFSRAAIEGGLSPETALTLTDHYFQSVESAKTVAELADISTSMQQDFVLRVHRARENRAYSKAVQSIVNYVELHVEEKISLSDLSRLTGYTDYYLSKKFKQETGESLKAFLLRKRLERAQFLLSSTDMSLRDISEKLCFHSQSYFTEQFRKQMGVSPAKYREEHRHS